jgi:hypothetical protein
MFRRHRRAPVQRRAVILLVVVILLTLFATVGVAFVLYAQSEAEAARLSVDAEAPTRADVDPEALLNYFLGQLVYDVADDDLGVYSALRGHSLARLLYGYDPASPNDHSFTGVGRLHTYGQGVESKKPFPSPPSYLNPFYLPLFKDAQGQAAGNPVDDHDLVNYTFFRDDAQVVPLLGAPFLRDPERLNPRPNTGPPSAWWPGPARPATPPWRTDPSQPPGPYTGGVNAPYTYPDANNLFLAAVRADGSVLLPSFHRPWLGIDSMDSADPAYWKWVLNTDPTPGPGRGRPVPWLKYMTLRPRPADNPGFPPPEDGGGDVKNLMGSPGTLIPGSSPQRYWHHDSIWLDLGFPVLTAPNGQRYKPLFAPLIVDLDNRVNLNVAGNVRGSGGTHASNQGWGPWEINPARVLDQPATEPPGLLVGAQGRPGRYGLDRRPGAGGIAPGIGATPHFYARADFDGANEWAGGAPTGPVQLPAANSFTCFPSFPAGYGDGSLVERWEHPRIYDYYRRAGDDLFFGLWNLEAPLRYADTGSPALTADLFRLAPGNFQGASRRNLVTTHSCDLDRAGAAPGIWDPLQQPYTYDVGRPAPAGLGNTAFPWLSQRYGNNYPRGAATMNVALGSEFAAPDLPAADPRVDWRSRVAGLPRLDVNRPLPDYPAPDPATGVVDLTDLATRRRFQAATAARQGLARDLFLALVTATAATDPRTTRAPPASPDLALGWLAQLAVNMVDFIDSDDYVTPFNWGGDPLIWTTAAAPPYPGEWVFGTELPRVVLNEALVWYDGRFENIWLELHNTFNTDPTLTDDVLGTRGAARLQVPGGHNVYQVILAHGVDTSTGLPRAAVSTVANFSPPPGPAGVDPTVILPSDGRYAGPNGGNQGFYLLGPRLPGGPAVPFPGNAPPALPVATLATPGMRFPTRVPFPPTLILQRLACPHCRENDPARPGYDPALPYNPFVTVDSMERVEPSYFNSYGRVQPYAGANLPALRRAQQPLMFPPGGPYPAQPQHTFFQHNAREIAPALPNPARAGQTLQQPFDWPVQLDRPLISPMELLNVSACPPHQFTRRFCQTFTTAALGAVGAPGAATVSAATQGFSGGYPWNIRAGTLLDVDTGARRETVTVLTAGNGTFTAVFTKPHPARFLITGPQPFAHLVPWFNQTNRLYRVFEFLETRSRAAGLEAPSTSATGGVSAGLPFPCQVTVAPARMHGVSSSGVPWSIEAGDTLVIDGGAAQENVVVLSTTATQFTAVFVQPHSPGFPIALTRTGERIPGKININTVWDVATLQAVCDPQSSNHFTAAQVDAMWNDLVSTTNPQARTRGAGGTPSGGDHPFRGMAVPFTAGGPNTQYPDGLGINDTFFRAGSSGDPLFQVPGTGHPYQQNELLTKVFNNLTTRSNVFAVWLTVGFFQVTDESVRPVKLGAEIGRAETRHVRHRLFAIVDRTNVTAQANAAFVTAYPTAPGVLPPGTMPAQVTTTTAAVAAGAQTVAVGALHGFTPVPTPPEGPAALHTAWDIHAGMALVIERGTPREETVLVTAVGPAGFTANFAHPHPTAASVTVLFYRGNPGPQPAFRVRENKDVVPYFSVIY